MPADPQRIASGWLDGSGGVWFRASCEAQRWVPGWSGVWLGVRYRSGRRPESRGRVRWPRRTLPDRFQTGTGPSARHRASWCKDRHPRPF